MKLLIVSQSPTKQNLRQDVALVGTRSYTRVLEWMHAAKINYFDCDIINACSGMDARVATEGDIFKLSQRLQFIKYDGIIALGKTAAWALKAAGAENVFEMPHPSGQNRKLNDKEFVAKKLEELKQYVDQRRVYRE